MEPTNRTTTTARPRSGSIPAQGGSGAGQSTGRSGAFEEDAERRRFVTVLRGYDRIEVDEYIDDLLAVVTTLRSSADSWRFGPAIQSNNRVVPGHS